MPIPTAIDYFSQLPIVPTSLPASDIRGSLPSRLKEVGANLMAFVFTTKPSYSWEIGRRIKLVETNAWQSKDTGEWKAETICEVTVEKDMCNKFRVMSGACVAYLIDMCSSGAPVCLGLATGNDGSGASRSMNIEFHHPVPLGTELRIVSTIIVSDRKSSTTRCEIQEGLTKKVLVSAVHSQALGLLTKHMSKL